MAISEDIVDAILEIRKAEKWGAARIAAHGTMVKEWLRRRPYDSEQDRTEALAPFLNYYNFERNHSALGWFPPVTRTPLRGDQVVPQVNQTELVAPPTEDQATIFDYL